MKKYDVTIRGITPLLMHRDNIAWADQMKQWEKDPRNKAVSIAGDDRTPSFRWLGSLYHDETRVVMPADCIMACLMYGGARTPTGKGKATFKSQTQSGIMPVDLYWPLTVNGKEIPVAPIFLDMESRSWEAFNDLISGLGFILFVKRARVGQAFHIRVRPRFNEWMIRGGLVVTDAAITETVLKLIGSQAGQYVGLGDWRPGSKKPGAYGMFTFDAIPVK